MADETADAEAVTDEELEGEEAEGKGKKSKKKLFIIAGAAALVVILGAGAGAFFLLSSGEGEPEEQSVAHIEPAYYLELPTMTVNLNTVDGEVAQYLKISVSLELADEETSAAIQPRLPQVTDAFQVYLRELRRSDLEGSAGIYRLKEELRRRVNLAIYPIQIDDILFKEILVQ